MKIKQKTVENKPNKNLEEILEGIAEFLIDPELNKVMKECTGICPIELAYLSTKNKEKKNNGK